MCVHLQNPITYQFAYLNLVWKKSLLRFVLSFYQFLNNWEIDLTHRTECTLYWKSKSALPSIWITSYNKSFLLCMLPRETYPNINRQRSCKKINYSLFDYCYGLLQHFLANSVIFCPSVHKTMNEGLFVLYDNII